MRARERTYYVITSAFVLAIAITMVVPFVFMISMSLKPESEVFINPLQVIPERLYLQNYRDVFANEYYIRWYVNSFVAVGLTILSRLFVVTIAAYAFARLEFRGRDVLFIVVLSGMMITPETTIIARYIVLRQLHLTDTVWAIVIPSSFQVFFLFLFRQFFLRIPRELSEAAVIDGCSHFKVYVRIILPLVVPALITSALFTFIWTWNDFLNPFVFITSIQRQLLTVGLKYFVDENASQLATQMAGASFGVLPPVLLFLFAQRYFLSNLAESGIKG
jgi:multiple sugar transport system permease protein